MNKNRKSQIFDETISENVCAYDEKNYKLEKSGSSFDINDAKDYLEKFLKRNFDSFKTNSDDSISALNVIISAYHLREWMRLSH